MICQVPDDAVPKVTGVLDEVVAEREAVARIANHIELETYVSQNFMGLFVEQAQADYLKNLATLFAKKLAQLSNKLILLLQCSKQCNFVLFYQTYQRTLSITRNFI